MIDFQNATYLKLRKVSADSLQQSLTPLMTDGELVIGAYKGARDYCVFTNKRVIAINVQGMTGKKRDYTSMPYSKISVFSIETAGTLDFDSELEMYFSGVGKVSFEFTGNSDILKIGQVISNYTL